MNIIDRAVEQSRNTIVANARDAMLLYGRYGIFLPLILLDIYKPGHKEPFPDPSTYYGIMMFSRYNKNYKRTF